MLTVMKFGGTSVGSVEALERVANIVVGTEGNKVVVTSAMSGITNFLVDFHQAYPAFFESRSKPNKIFRRKPPDNRNDLSLQHIF